MVAVPDNCGSVVTIGFALLGKAIGLAAAVDVVAVAEGSIAVYLPLLPSFAATMPRALLNVIDPECVDVPGVALSAAKNFPPSKLLTLRPPKQLPNMTKTPITDRIRNIEFPYRVLALLSGDRKFDVIRTTPI